MKVKKYLALSLFVTIVVLISAFPADCARKPAQEPIAIGALAELTGPLSATGPPVARGATIALEMVGYQAEGRPLKLIVADTATNPAVTLDKTRKMVETDKVRFIVGPLLEAGALAIGPYLDRVEVPAFVIQQLVADGILKHKWVWVPGGELRNKTYGFGLFAYDELGHRTVSQLLCEVAGGPGYAEGFEISFTGRGGKIVQRQLWPLGTKDFAPYILRLKEADALHVFLPGEHTIFLHTQAKALGLKMPIISSPGEMVNPGLVKAIAAAGAPPIGVKFMATWMHTLDTPGSKEFVKAYKEKWGEAPPHLAASAYRNVQIILEILRRTGGDTSSSALAKALSNLSVQTIEGGITFTRDRTPIRNMFAGEFIEVKGEWLPKHLKTYRVVSERVGDKLVPKLAK